MHLQFYGAAGEVTGSCHIVGVQGRTLLLDCGADDFPRIGELLDRYADLRLGLADAAVVACAERRRSRVLTLDFRDFVPVAREGRIELVLAG